MDSLLQFIKCLLGFHQMIGIGRVVQFSSVSSDNIYASGCLFCGYVKLLYIRHAAPALTNKERR